MNAVVTTQVQSQVKAALFACDSTFAAQIDALIQATGSEHLFTTLRAEPTIADTTQCDFALVLFDPSKDIVAFAQGIATLKLVKKIPVVVALVPESHRTIIQEQQEELAADELFYFPLSPDQFAKILKTYTTSLLIAQAEEANDSGRSFNLFGEILVQNGIIDALMLKKALDFQKRSGSRLGDALVELGFIDEDQKIHFLASQLHVPLTTSRQYSAADINVVSMIPESIARRHHCLALEKNGNQLVVAMVDVLDLRLLDSLRDSTELTIVPILGKRYDITESIDRYYRDISSHKDAHDLMADLGDRLEFMKATEEDIDLAQAASEGAELGIVKLVNMMIANAVRDRASDIHIEPMEKELLIRYRIDGDLRKVMQPPKKSHSAILTRIKILSDLDIAERRLPQDGRMVVKLNKREVDIRVSLLPSIFGEKAVLRILDKEAFEKSVTNLGFTQYELGLFKSQIAKPYGMIIVTGPTGSGKSTTLYSSIQAIKTVTKNIITVEDPVEFHMEHVTQVNVNPGIGLTFAGALRSILRQDPDIVMIGEVRDAETADIAIKMALTGHLVFSSLHTNDAIGAIARFVDIGIPPLLLSSALNVVIAQRLVRRICSKCKVEYEPENEMVEELGLTNSPKPHLYKGEGCVTCNGTGYKGRIGIFEMLAITKEIRTLILRNGSADEIKEVAIAQGMKSLRQAGIELALSGETTIEQVIAVTTET